MTMSSVAMRTRAKPAVKLVFEPSRLRIRGQSRSQVKFAELHEDVAFSWKEQDQELATRQLARALVMDSSKADRSASSNDHVLRDEDGNPVAAVFCTDEVAVELELKVLILLRRRRECEKSERLVAQRYFRRLTQSPSRRRKVPAQHQEQGQLSGSRSSGGTTGPGGSNSITSPSSSDDNSVSSASGISSLSSSGGKSVSKAAGRTTNSSSHGDNRSAVGFRLGEDLGCGLHSTPPFPVVGEARGGTRDDLEVSKMLVQELFPALLDTQEMIGGSMSPATALLPSIDLFESSLGDWAAGDNHNRNLNLFELSEAQQAELSNMLAADTAAATATPDPNPDHDEVGVLQNIGVLDHIGSALLPS